MANRKAGTPVLLAVLVSVAATSASAQSFRVQCPTTTITHPDKTTAQLVNSTEPAYTGPTTLGPATSGGYLAPTANVNGAIKCQISSRCRWPKCRGTSV